jgi:hypothetical protein
MLPVPNRLKDALSTSVDARNAPVLLLRSFDVEQARVRVQRQLDQESLELTDVLAIRLAFFLGATMKKRTGEMPRKLRSRNGVCSKRASTRASLLRSALLDMAKQYPKHAPRVVYA